MSSDYGTRFFSCDWRYGMARAGIFHACWSYAKHVELAAEYQAVGNAHGFEDNRLKRK